MKIKIVVLFLCLLAFSSGYFLISKTEKEFDYTYTKAICEGSTCADYYVTCSEGEVREVTRISGFVTFEDWEDTREDKEIRC